MRDQIMKFFAALLLIICLFSGCGEADKPTEPNGEHDQGTVQT